MTDNTGFNPNMMNKFNNMSLNGQNNMNNDQNYTGNNMNNNSNNNNMPNMNPMNNMNYMNYMNNPAISQMIYQNMMMNGFMPNYSNMTPIIPNNYNPPNNDEITINVHLDQDKVVQIQFSQQKTIEELTKKIKMDCKIPQFFKLMLKGKNLVNSMTLAESYIENGSNIYVIFLEDRFDDDTGYLKPIEMSFKMDKKNRFDDEEDNSNININIDLINIAKVCYLKEIASRLSDDNINKFEENISIMIKLLKNGKIFDLDNLKSETKELLEKIRQTNLLNLANFIGNLFNPQIIQNMLNLLYKDDLLEVNELKNKLAKINNKIIMFSKDFDTARKKSIFEYSLCSLEIADRSDIDDYANALQNCPNKNERILYYGTPEDNVRGILKNHFKISDNTKFGKGIYLSNSLDLSSIFSREAFTNRFKLPEINELFSFIVSSVFYNNKTRKRVMDNNYSPQNNEANVAIVDGKLNPIKGMDKSRFYSREYIIGNTSQILPLMHITIKRNEYCVIWRDNNLSPKAVWNDKYDKIFKDFLKKRMEYISQFAKFNIYPCITTEEALNLVEKKRFNKIILMSNVGKKIGENKYEGSDFVDKARKIIGNDVITLFLAYMDKHLKWIKDYKNSMFSNIEQFHEQYLECFTDDIKVTKQNIMTLKSSIEDFYKVKFTFDDNFLTFPNFKDDGEFKDLKF